ncbi:MAG: arylsulfatase [Actinomycetes bacterium]
MSNQTTDVLVAAYQDLGAAHKDFDAVVELVKSKAVKVEGVILVAHEADGSVTVLDTGDHVGRKGMGWGGGVGLVVGLFSPPLLASVVVGAAAGGVVGKFADHKLKTGLHDEMGEALPPGSAGIIAAFDDDQRLAIEKALPGSPAKSIVEAGGKGLVRDLKASLAEAMGKFKPDRSRLPIAEPNFGGTIGRTLDQSVADWTINMTPTPPEGAPNVLLVLIDDSGFGNPGTFGGPVSTPNMDRVGTMGLRYNRFHVTAMCAPTRAATLTGRNNHAVGFGSLPEFPGPFPGYTSMVPKSCTPFPRILRDNGYATAGFGKWHLTPDHVQGAAGPHDHWPMGWGFDHFWGFLGAESGQYDPLIIQDNMIIGVPEGKDGEEFYLPDAMTDQTVAWLHAVRAQDPVKPWFAYYSTGCAHAPHQVQVEWSEKYRGKFDQGWDKLREETLARQKQLGVVPEDTVLTPRPDVFPAWDSLSDNEKKLYARQMEVYAGYQENADHNVGRLLDAIDEMGELDNTLVFFIFGDNGASLEGTVTGSFNEMTMANGIALTPDQQLSLLGQYGGLDAWGTDAYAPHYAAAWAWAGNTPFQWGKQVGSHLGGTRDGMVVAWPDRIKDVGGHRTQLTHCIDLGPTILEAAGIPEPTVVDGVEQEAMHGTSFVYTFDDENAPERHTVQYWETYGNRAIYKDGWWACARLDRIPWDTTKETIARLAPGVYDPGADTWELYYLPDDFSQAKDLAKQNPAKLNELQELFWQQAEQYKVLPLLGGMSVFFGILPPLPTVTRTTFHGDVQNIASGMIPRIYGHSYAIEAELDIPKDGAEGVIVAEADEMGGFSLWVDSDGKLHHSYSMMAVEQYRQVSSKPLPTGNVTVKLQFDADEAKPGTGGNVTLWANDEQIGEGRMDQTVALRFSFYAGMDIGRDHGMTVDSAYRDKAPYLFTGTVKKVVFDLKPDTHEDEKKLHAAAAHGATAAGMAG